MNSVWGWYRETAMVIIFYTMQSKAKLAGLLLKANFFYCFLIVPFLLLTLVRTCKFIPPPWTVVQGGGVDGPPPPRVFDTLQYFETILPSVESLWYSPQDEVYFIGDGAARGPMTSPKMVTILDLPRIRNQVKTARNGDFFVLEKKNNTK